VLARINPNLNWHAENNAANNKSSTRWVQVHTPIPLSYDKNILCLVLL